MIVGQRAADMRYVGQEHAVTVDLPIELFTAQDRDGIKRQFDAVHQMRYGFSAAGEQAEIVSLRSAVIGVMQKPPFEHIAAGGDTPPDAAACRGNGRCISPARRLCRRRRSYDRTALQRRQPDRRPGADRGTCVDHGRASRRPAEVDAFGDLVIAIGRS